MSKELSISQRGLQMPASPIRKLAPLAYKAEDEGVKIYRLNIGQPDLPTPQKALDALKTVDRKTLEYSPSQGNRSLRQALVNYYDRYQIKLNADEIIITSGGSEAVLFAFMSCLNPGDEIIVPEPAYANYMAFAVSAGAVIRTVTTTIEEKGKFTPLPMGAFYTVAKLPVDDAEKFCAWCLSDFRYVDEKTPSLKPSGSREDVTAETIMMAPASGFYTSPEIGKQQVRLAYVLCKEDIQRTLMILEKAIEEYNSLGNNYEPRRKLERKVKLGN